MNIIAAAGFDFVIIDLEHGVKIRTVKVDGAKINVDTPEDLDAVRQLMLEDKLKFQYMEDDKQ